MKKTKLINSHISQVIASLGHMDMICIGDAGLPIPFGVPKIDLALTKNIPTFLDVIKIVSTEACFQEVILAKELKRQNKNIEQEILKLYPNIKITYIPHNELKILNKNTKVNIRTGEMQAYHNAIFVSGVVF